MKRKTEIAIIGTLSTIVFAVILLSIFYGFDKMFAIITYIEEPFMVSLDQIRDDEFIQFAVIVNFFYEWIPQLAHVIGIGAISTQLLMRGFNPWILGLIVATGNLIGQLILYTVGRLIYTARKKTWGSMASVQHFFHKYHYLVFLLPPWLGVVGDAIMIYAGHERISVWRIIPILFITDLAGAYRWIFPTVGQLEITDLFQ